MRVTQYGSVLTISEIYASVQGESTHVGRPCVFVRLAACNLRCVWCDTPYAFTGGTKMSLVEIMTEVARYQCQLVEITGGEPLLQPGVHDLMARLVAEGYDVLLETGGHVPIDDVPDEVMTILDVKCPGSGEAKAMHWPNLDQVSARDEVKFVIQDRADYDYAREVVGLGAGEILLTSMDRDGTRSGFDVELTRAVADAVSVPVIASGGVGTLDHLVDGVRLGHASAVLAASIFHFGTFTIGQAKRHMAAAGIPVRLDVD